MVLEENRIEDYEYYIETSEADSITTEKINGFLLGIFLIPFSKGAYKKYDINISFENYPTIFLLDEQQVIYEPMYIPIKVDCWNVNKRQYEMPDWWALNDKLKINVEGKAIKLKIIFRMMVY